MGIDLAVAPFVVAQLVLVLANLALDLRDTRSIEEYMFSVVS